MKKTNSITEKDVIELVKELVGRENVHRNVPGRYSATGYPDLFLVDKGELISCEIKIQDRELTYQQYEFLDTLKRAVVLHVDRKKQRLNFYFKRSLWSIPYDFIELKTFLNFRFRANFEVLYHDWSEVTKHMRLVRAL